MQLKYEDSETRELDETVAAHAGIGYRLSNNFRDPIKCDSGEYSSPTTRALAVTFTNDSLSIRNMLLYLGRHYSEESWSINTNLGFKCSFESSDYWERLGGEIVTQASLNAGEVDELLVLGECAEEKRFLDTLWRTLGEMEDQGLLNGRAADIYSNLQACYSEHIAKLLRSHL